MFLSKDRVSVVEFEDYIRNNQEYQALIKRERLVRDMEIVCREINRWGYKITINEVKVVVYIARESGLKGIEIDMDFIDKELDKLKELKNLGYECEDILILKTCGYDYQYLKYVRDSFSPFEKSKNITKRLLKVKDIDYKQYKKDCIFLKV